MSSTGYKAYPPYEVNGVTCYDVDGTDDRLYVVVADTGVVADVLRQDWDWEGPTCSICDGLGHGYPGGGPCPLEDTMSDAEYEMERREWALDPQIGG